ncbi:MAG: hypothetical protein FGM52_13625, partial [Mycobacterium sp.]|nr:hypothetical protein [Mycobacterium sp.]
MTRLQVEQRRFVRACTAGLSEKTALVALSVQGDVSPAADRRIRAAAPGLYPAEPLYGITETDWPGAFLVHQPAGPPADVDDGYLGRLGEWVVALTVAIQRWGRDPVWRGRVLAAGQGRLRLAIPWHRPDFFDAALSVALELVSDWCGPVEGSQSQPAWQSWLSDEPDRVHRLDRYFDGRWPDIQAGGFAPNTLRFMEAAARRQIPVDVLPSFVQIGWGAHSLRFDMATTGQTSWIAKTMAKNKLKTSRTLANAGIPVPPCGLVSDLGQARRAAEELGWPVVVKPLDQDGGNAVAPGIRDPDRLAQAFDAASRLSPGRVLV